MAAQKTLAYTVEQTAELVSAYAENPTAETVAAFAEKFGKTVKSVVAKLAREGVYKKAEYVSKTGEKPQSKGDIVTQINDVLGGIFSDAELESMEKMNKTALIKLLGKL